LLRVGVWLCITPYRVAGISTQHQPVFSSNLSIPVGRQ
jgi:hypothetical protein